MNDQQSSSYTPLQPPSGTRAGSDPDGFVDPAAQFLPTSPTAEAQRSPNPVGTNDAPPTPEQSTPAATAEKGGVTQALSGAAGAVRDVKQGAAVGARLGGAHGAVIGAIAGAATTITTSRHKGKIGAALLCLLLPGFLLLVMLGASAAALGSTFADQMSTTAMSRNRASGAITGEQAGDYAEAATRSGVHWAVLAALETEVDSPAGEVAADADSGVPTPNPNPGAPLNVKIASWNTLKSNSTNRVIDSITKIGDAGADVIGLQEVTPDSKRNMIRARLGTQWGMSKVDNAVLIVWRRDRVDLVAQHSQRVFEHVSVESGGVGGGSFGPKSLQWAEFRTKTGAHFAVINNHLLPSIETRGKPNPRHPKRVAAAERQMDAALATSDKLQAAGLATFITGDHNIAAAADARVQDSRFPHVRYASHGQYSNWRTLGYPKRGTQAGGRLIDYVFASNTLAAPISQTILPRYGSDHNAILVEASNDPNARPKGAADASAKTGSGGTPSLPSLTTGVGPFHLDVATFNELATTWDIDPLTNESAARRDDAGTAVGRLLDRLLSQADPVITMRSLTAGATSTETTRGQMLQLGTGPDDVAAQDRTRAAFTKALAQLPIENADQRAQPWFQIALMFALGNPPDTCTTEATTTPPSDLSPTGTPPTLPSTSTNLDPRRRRHVHTGRRDPSTVG